MLTRLSIQSFALVDDIELDFRSGMTVLVGETGAGKSIIIDALTIALGERTSASSMRSGAKKSIVEAIFNVGSHQGVINFLSSHELQWDNDDLVLRREMLASGTSRCFVNDSPVPASVVQELSEMLIDFHGQHDTHGLLNAKNHLAILDSVSADEELCAEMRQQWNRVLDVRKLLKNLNDQAASIDEVRSRLEFVVNDIGTAAAEPDELGRIVEELRRAESSETIITSASTVQGMLYSDEPSAFDLIQQAKEKLLGLIQFDATLSAAVNELESAAETCKEAAGAVARLADPEDFSPERLEFLRQRQSQLQRLVRKYGSLDVAIETLTSSRRQLAILEDLDSAILEAERSVGEAQTEARQTSNTLSERRKASAKQMCKSITESLQQMGMPSAQFEVRFNPTELSASGGDGVEFLLTANTGESPLPLARIASGGELSRVMLAIKKVQASKGSVGTMVFDEIDIGISGRIARAVGDVMKDLCSRHQIICISHLPQIASLADTMIRVQKVEDKNSTTVNAEEVVGEEAVLEIARMISGASVTSEALEGARSLLGTLKKSKRS
ncbi:MAG: DNA repair protein RecN [Ignavibacteria bacterium]|nr:DNA repair protein RecN [Ignavibacteria bacterium]